MSEGFLPNAGDAFGDSNANQATAVIECPPLNAGDAIANRHARQPTAVSEGTISDESDAVGDSNAGQPTTAREGRTPNAGDRFLPIGRANHQFPSSIFITSSYSNRFSLNLVSQRIGINRRRHKSNIKHN